MRFYTKTEEHIYKYIILSRIMQVYECLLWGVIPERIISDSLVDFVEDQVARKLAFKVKSVPEGTNPVTITNGLIGYYPPYGIAYLSNPNAETGLTGIDVGNKRLIHAKNETPFFKHRDSIVYSTPEHRYVREDYIEVLKEFQTEGYRVFRYIPKGIGDTLMRYKNFSEVQIGEELHITDLV